MGDVEDFPDMRVDGASPGPRVTFNIQDTVKYMHFFEYYMLPLFCCRSATEFFRQMDIFSIDSVFFLCAYQHHLTFHFHLLVSVLSI